MSSDINFVTSMMSSDIVVTFITTRCAMTFVFDIPVEFTFNDICDINFVSFMMSNDINL